MSGAALADFSTREIQRIRDQVVADAADRKVVPIVLTPFSRHDDPEKNAAYWSLKHAFLSKGLPIQVIATETVADHNKLKWSTASIGLQVFAKLGGTPWKVRPETENRLIVGIGQAHHKSEERIDRYFAYSVLTDSSGVFEEVRVLGEAQDEEHYIEGFSPLIYGKSSKTTLPVSLVSWFTPHSLLVGENWRALLQHLRSKRSNRKKPENSSRSSSTTGIAFFGFAVDHNSRVPYESTVIPLSRNEFLVWFEGLQYGQPTLRKMVGSPLHVKFTYPNNGLTRDQQRAHLQDAINLSGANWRGFNAKSLPVSVYYAQIIATFTTRSMLNGTLSPKNPSNPSA